MDITLNCLLNCAKKSKKKTWNVGRGVALLQVNAPAHTSEIAMQAARSSGIEILPHPAYSPDLAPSDFWLFPKLKKFLKGQRFSTDDEVENATRKCLEDQPSDFFLEGIRKLKD